MAQDTLVLSVKEMAAQLQISMPRAYSLTETEGFPLIRVGRKKLIPAEQLDAWLKRQGEAGARVL